MSRDRAATWAAPHGSAAGVLGRRTAIVAALAAAFSVGSAVTARAADPRLTDADAALQKAKALVQAAEIGTTSPLRRRAFELHTNLAAELIERAREQIQAAQNVADAATS